jgi:hypothetical protein
MDYVPTAFYGAVVVVSPDARAAKHGFFDKKTLIFHKIPE